MALAFAVVDSLDASASALGLVLGSYSLSRVAFTLGGGVWADRLQRRQVLLGCDAIRGGAQFVAFTVLIAGLAEVWMLMATAAVLGGASAFFGPASTGLVAELVSLPRRQQANALLGISESATSIVGPALSGVIVAVLGPAWAFAIDGASFAASFAFVAAMRIAPRGLPAQSSFVSDLAAGWHEVRSRTWLWACLIGFGLNNLASATFYVLGPVIFAEKLGGAADWGLVLGIGGAGALIGGVVALRWRPERPLLGAVIVWATFALPFAALASSQTAVVVGVAAAASFGGAALGNAIWEALLQEQIPDELLSRVSSYDWLVSLVFQPIGFALAGPVATAVGNDTTLWAATAVTVAVHVAWLLLPDVWRLRRPDSSRGELPT